MKVEVFDIEKPNMELDYHSLNAKLNLMSADGKLQLDADKAALKKYFIDEVNQKTIFFHDIEEKIDFLVENNYYEEELIELYRWEFIKQLFKKAYSYRYRFESFLGAFKYYTSYTLKTFDNKRFLERYEDRMVMNALYLANGDEKLAEDLLDELMSGTYQPATPTFLNAGKAQRGEMVSCYLLRMEDNMESISRSVNAALQLSKRGGGVAFNLTNIREAGAPIKNIDNAATGVVPIMKIFEDTFSYANQLGARQGAGAVYLNAHHPDIVSFLDTKRENADEKIRIKTLSVGVIIPDVTFKLAKENKDMYLFSPYDVEREYGVPFSEISVTEEYSNLVDNPRIKKKKINARKLFAMLAEISFESGYPFLLFEDNVNRQHPNTGKVTMSNLCSEILMSSKPSEYNTDISYKVIGEDISCNLGSLNIAKTLDKRDLAKTVETAMRALTTVSDLSNIDSVPSIKNGNSRKHAVGLGAMNLHGFLGRERIMYDSPEAVDFTNMFFYAVNYQTIVASNKIAEERGVSYADFKESDYYSGEYFKKYIEGEWKPKTEKVKALLEKFDVYIPTQEDWRKLAERVREHGLYHAYRLAIAPTGSIAYCAYCTQSIMPHPFPIEARKEGKIGRVYRSAPYMTEDNLPFFKSAYAIGYSPLIDIVAAAQQHVDQGISTTLFFTDKATTRDLNKAYIEAWRKGLKTIYYCRVKPGTVVGTEVDTANDFCEACQI